MMALGHAAGLAAVQAAETGRPVNALDIRAIQEELQMPPE